jgi:hypothetical protein
LSAYPDAKIALLEDVEPIEGRAVWIYQVPVSLRVGLETSVAAAAEIE